MNVIDLKDVCPTCSKEVRPLQHALLCDKCSLWFHRKCGSDMNQATYRAIRNGNRSFDWTCKSCTEVSDVLFILMQT